MSCRRARSPVKTTTGTASSTWVARPRAVDVMPSMPAAPRLPAKPRRVPAGTKASRSRGGIEFDAMTIPHSGRPAQSSRTTRPLLRRPSIRCSSTTAVATVSSACQWSSHSLRPRASAGRLTCTHQSASTAWCSVVVNEASCQRCSPSTSTTWRGCTASSHWLTGAVVGAPPSFTTTSGRSSSRIGCLSRCSAEAMTTSSCRDGAPHGSGA